MTMWGWVLAYLVVGAVLANIKTKSVPYQMVGGPYLWVALGWGILLPIAITAIIKEKRK